jgi:hypothetical protein
MTDPVALTHPFTAAQLDAAGYTREGAPSLYAEAVTYTWGQYTRSFKRDGRHGAGYAVARPGLYGHSVAVALVDTEPEAIAVAMALNADTVSENDVVGMRLVARAAREEKR